MIVCNFKWKAVNSLWVFSTYQQRLHRRALLHPQFEHTGPAIRTSAEEYQCSRQGLQQMMELTNSLSLAYSMADNKVLKLHGRDRCLLYIRYRHFGSSPYSSFQLNALMLDICIEAFNASWQFFSFWMATSSSRADLQLPQFSRLLKMIMFMKTSSKWLGHKTVPNIHVMQWRAPDVCWQIRLVVNNEQ
jgi:hypothetical protein